MANQWRSGSNSPSAISIPSDTKVVITIMVTELINATEIGKTGVVIATITVVLVMQALVVHGMKQVQVMHQEMLPGKQQATQPQEMETLHRPHPANQNTTCSIMLKE